MVPEQASVALADETEKVSLKDSNKTKQKTQLNTRM